MAAQRAPVEAKTQAAGLSGAAAGIILYLLQTYAFKGNAVPAGLVSLIDAVVPGLVAFVGAYLAPHTPRPAPVPVSAASLSRGGYPSGSVSVSATPPPPAREPGGTA